MFVCVCVCVCKDIYLCFEGLSDDGPVPHGVQTVPGSTHIPWRQGALWWVWLQEYQLLQPAGHRVKLWLVGQQQQLVEKYMVNNDGTIKSMFTNKRETYCLRKEKMEKMFRELKHTF